MIKKLLLTLIVLFPLLGKSQPNFFWDQLTRLHAPTNLTDTVLIGTTKNLYLVSTGDFVNWVLTNNASSGAPFITIQGGNGNNNTLTNPTPLNMEITTNLAWWASNAVWSTPVAPLGLAPIDVADAKGAITVLDFGDSTAEYLESPVQQVMEKLLERYGFGGFVCGPSPGSTMFASPQTKGQGFVWLVTNGLVTINNGQNTATPFWGSSHAIINVTGTLMFTNEWYLPPGANQSVLNPLGQWPGATKGIVWYEQSPTNSLGQFQVLASTNGGPFGVAASINCNGGSRLTTTNVVIQFSSIPTTNFYQLMVTGTVGTVRIPQMSLRNEYAGLTHYKISQGGWNVDRYWQPNLVEGAPIALPAVDPMYTNTHNNLFKDSPPDLTLSSLIHFNTDSQNLTSPFETYSNLAFRLGELSQSINLYSPKAANIWITQFPMATNVGVAWPYQPWAILNIFNTNTTGHDYVYIPGRTITAERWTQLFGINPFFGLPHWSSPAGYYAANELLKELNSWSYAYKTYRGDLAANKANAGIIGSFGIDVTNGADVSSTSKNFGYSFSMGGDAGTNTRTAGTTHIGYIGYPTPDSLVPNAVLVSLSAVGGGTPQTTIVFGDAGPNGQSPTITNLIQFRNQGTNTWNTGGGGRFLPFPDNGVLDYGAWANAAASLVLSQNGNVYANKYYGMGAGITNMWLAYSNDLHLITPQLYGAVGDGVTDDTVANNKCEGVTEALLNQGLDYASYYVPRVVFKMTGPLIITNRFNIHGHNMNWSGPQIGTTHPLSPTWVSSAKPAIQCAITNIGIYGGSMEWVSLVSSNTYNHGYGNIDPGQIGMYFYATNTGMSELAFRHMQVSGFWANFTGTNMANELEIDDFNSDNGSNGILFASMQVGNGSGGFATMQSCKINRLTGNCYGVNLGLYETNSIGKWTIYNASFGTLVTNGNTVELFNVNTIMDNPNIESQSIVSNKFPVFMSGGSLDVRGGNMNLSSSPTFFCSNNAVFHVYGNTPLSSGKWGDQNLYAAVFKNNPAGNGSYGCFIQTSSPTTGGYLVTNADAGRTELIGNYPQIIQTGANGTGGSVVGPVIVGNPNGDVNSVAMYNFGTAMRLWGPGYEWDMQGPDFANYAQFNGSFLQLNKTADGGHGLAGAGVLMTSNNPANFSPGIGQCVYFSSNGFPYIKFQSNSTTIVGRLNFTTP